MANPTLLCIACIMFIASILGIATTALGIECYNEHKTFKDARSQRFGFMTFNLVCAIFLLLASFVLLYMGFTADESKVRFERS